MQPPHIVLITADQLRKDALGCYGGDAVETPHIDRLANQSDIYERAYAVSPWCMPSRSSIATGLFPHTHRAYSNFRQDGLEPDLPNVHSLLKAQGYTTSQVGKCHFAPVPYGTPEPDRTLPYDEFRAHYAALGIDRLILQDGKQVSVWFEDDYSRELDQAGYRDAYRDAIWDRQNHKVFPFPGPPEWHPDAWTGRKTAELVEDHSPDKPLFIWLSFSGPHFPFDAPEEFRSRVNLAAIDAPSTIDGELADPHRIHHTSYYGPKGIEGAGSTGGQGTQVYTPEYWRELRTQYFANVALIDDEIGRLLDTIEQRLGDNVLIIFTADHGEMLGNHGLWGKHNCGYEDVLNVPLLVHHPHQQESTRLDTKVMLIDILPTCLAAAGTSGDVEGIALEPRRGHDDYPIVLAEGEGFMCVSNGQHKYVVATRDDERLRELFDLSTDPGETRNVISNPDLATTLNSLHEKVEDTFLSALLP